MDYTAKKNADSTDNDEVLCLEVKTDEFYNGSDIVRRHRRSCAAALGSAAQLGVNEMEVDPCESGILDAVDQYEEQLSEDSSPQQRVADDEEEEMPYGFSAAVLDSIDSFIQTAPLPWRIRTLLPQLFNFLPKHNPIMIGTALMSYLRGAKTSAKIITRTSASLPPVRSRGMDVLALDGRSSTVLRDSGVETTECID